MTDPPDSGSGGRGSGSGGRGSGGRGSGGDSGGGDDNPYSPPSVAVDVPEEPAPTPGASGGQAVFVPGGTPARAAVGLLWTALAAHLASGLFMGYLYLVLRRATGGQLLTQERADLLDGISTALTVLPLLVRLACAVPFCIWFVRVYRNLLALGVGSLTFPAGWAAGGWFVPFLNLVRPYQIAREIWLGSHAHTTIVDDVVRSRMDSRLVAVWWALYLAGNIVGYVGGKMIPDSGALGQLQTAYVVLVASDLLMMGAALAAIRLVHEIDARQLRTYRRLARDAAR